MGWPAISRLVLTVGCVCVLFSLAAACSAGLSTPPATIQVTTQEVVTVTSQPTITITVTTSVPSRTVPSESPAPTPAPTATSTFTATTPAPATATVLRVIDGDTIEIAIDGTVARVRYIGINTPEMDDQRPEMYKLAVAATEYNRQLVEGKQVTLESDVSDTDIFGRLLRYVYVGKLFVNEAMVLAGYAQVSTYPPDVHYEAVFLAAQRQAKEAGLGLWTPAPTTTTPLPTETTTAPVTGQSDVRITNIFYDGLVPSSESDEYVEITNFGSSDQDLEGWRLVDISEGYPSFVFPTFVLEAGQSIRVYTNEIHPEWGGFSFGYGRAIWNNSEPDIAVLYNDRNIEISRMSY